VNDHVINRVFKLTCTFCQSTPPAGSASQLFVLWCCTLW